jgi:hypothetical protein
LFEKNQEHKKCSFQGTVFLLGIYGSERQSLSQLVAFMGGFELFVI